MRMAEPDFEERLKRLEEAVAQLKASQNEPDLKPEYIEKLKKLEEEGEWHEFKDMDELKKLIEDA